MKNEHTSKPMHIFTDGACKGNPGPGGWAYVMTNDGSIYATNHGPEEHTTNNRMELTAVIKALEALCIRMDIEIFTDSKYVINGYLKIQKYIEQDWSHTHIANADLWKRLHTVASKHNVKFNWVKGHNGNPFNELADTLAKQAVPTW